MENAFSEVSVLVCQGSPFCLVIASLAACGPEIFEQGTFFFQASVLLEIF
jgi:hypothetical protein